MMDIKHGTLCSGVIEPHVAYDMPAAGYRVRMCCRCGVLSQTLPRLYDNYAGAAAAAQKQTIALPVRGVTPRREKPRVGPD